MIDYKYNEDKLLVDLKTYIDKTYDQHYAQGKYQATDVIVDDGHGEGFCLGNMMKYTKRYGKKGTPADWRKDLMKVLHYAIIMLDVHDQNHKSTLELDSTMDLSNITAYKYPNEK